MAGEYLRIKNWEKFQSYKDRRPAWVKYHVSLLDDHDLLDLPLHAQLVYDRLLLLAAKHDNFLDNDAKFIGYATHLPRKVVATALETLISSGFLELSSGHLGKDASQFCIPRAAEAEAEKERAAVLPVDKPVDNFALRAVTVKDELDSDRVASAARLLERVVGADARTPSVVAGLCKRLPKERIDEVTATLGERNARGPGLAVSLLKGKLRDFEAEIQAEGAA